MPFQGSRIHIILFGGALFVIILVAFAFASSGGQSRKNPAGLITCTVTSDIGLFQITITNQNVQGAVITKTASELPFSFNFTEGDTLKFNVTTLTGYQFNTWYFPSTGTFIRDNPLTRRFDNDFTITATFLL